MSLRPVFGNRSRTGIGHWSRNRPVSGKPIPQCPPVAPAVSASFGCQATGMVETNGHRGKLQLPEHRQRLGVFNLKSRTKTAPTISGADFVGSAKMGSSCVDCGESDLGVQHFRRNFLKVPN